MTSWRRLILTAAMCGALAAGVSVFTGAHLGSLARAQDRQTDSSDMQQSGRAPKPPASPQQVKSVEDLATVFRDVGKAVGPSVVQIEVTRTLPRSQMQERIPPDLFRYFFPDMPDMPPGFDQGQGEDQQQGPPPQIEGTGSGVIMDVDGSTGYIVTNNHVAGGAQEMKVTLSDGRQIEKATLVGADPKTDIAVVKIQADNLKPAKWGNSDNVDQGDWVLAFGSPFGYVGSMTHGIVSALKRTNVGILGAGGYEDFIQVDAPINPGNSGGPLVNIYGEVIGIDTAIATRSGGFMGIGFAIPSNQAKFVYQQLREHGKVTRGWLGVGIRDIHSAPEVRDIFRSYGYQGDTGVLVDQVFPGTPAQGKLRHGDIIVSLNGNKVTGTTDLRNAVASLSPGTEATFGVFRDGKVQDVKLKVAEQPADVLAAATGHGEESGEQSGGAQASSAASNFGLQLQTLNADLAQRLRMQNAPDAGAVVTRVDPRSIAARAGIRPGDVITEINGQKITSAADASGALDKADLSKGVRFYVTSRDGMSRLVFLKQGPG